MVAQGGDEAPSTAPKPIVSATPLKVGQQPNSHLPCRSCIDPGRVGACVQVPLLIQDQAFSRLEESQLVAKGLLSHRLVLHQLLLEDAADPRLEVRWTR